MYYTTGFDECLGNLVVLASTRSDKPVRNEQELITGLRDFVAATNVTPVPADPLHLVTDEDRLRTLARRFHREPAEHDGPLGAPAESAELFWDGLRLLPRHAQRLLFLLVSEVALFDGTLVVSGSGALVEQLGSIYIAPEPSWNPPDMAECLIHEMTHLLLRCDEHRFGHYIDPVDALREQEFSPTAVSLTLRSPMVVFHSLIVAAEIVGLREEVRRTASSPSTGGVHGPDSLLIKRALRCADEVLRRPDRDVHYGKRAVRLMHLATARLQKAALPERKAS